MDEQGRDGECGDAVKASRCRRFDVPRNRKCVRPRALMMGVIEEERSGAYARDCKGVLN
jgi:hypothetical protein